MGANTGTYSAAVAEENAIQPGSLLVFTADDPRAGELIQIGGYATTHVVKDVTDSPAAAILVRK